MRPRSPSEVVEKWDTWEILAAPYLDTEHDPEWKEAFASELQRRGITGFALWWRKVVTALGLWWNVLWWEWVLLGKQDIIFGWALNLALIGPCILGWIFGWVVGVVTLVVWFVATRPLLKLFVKTKV